MQKQLLSLFSGQSVNGVLFHHVVRLVHILPVSITVLYYGRFHSSSMLITKKLHSAGGECMFIRMFTFQMPFQLWLSSYPDLSLNVT